MDDGQELKPVPGLWKVVEWPEVEAYSREGWQLARVVPESRVEHASESVPFLIPGQSYPTMGSGTKSHTVSTARYVLFKDEQSAIAQLHAEAKKQYVELRDTQQKLAEQELAFKELFKTSLKLTESEKTSKTIAENCEVQAREDRIKIHKMEQDLAKLRNAFGELKVKEILGDVTIKELLKK